MKLECTCLLKVSWVLASFTRWLSCFGTVAVGGLRASYLVANAL